MKIKDIENMLCSDCNNIITEIKNKGYICKSCFELFSYEFVERNYKIGTKGLNSDGTYIKHG